MTAAMDPSRLLKRLEPPVRPLSAAAPERAARSPIEQRGFDELLALVSTGDMRSGRAVTVPDQVDLREPLTAEQLDRLAAAGDLAEASGAQRSLMLIDGRGLVMDVESRTVTSELGRGDGHRVLGVDAAVYVASDDESMDSNRPLPLPPAGVLPPGIAEQLVAQMDHNAAGRNRTITETHGDTLRHTEME